MHFKTHGWRYTSWIITKQVTVGWKLTVIGEDSLFCRANRGPPSVLTYLVRKWKCCFYDSMVSGFILHVFCGWVTVPQWACSCLPANHWGLLIWKVQQSNMDGPVTAVHWRAVSFHARMVIQSPGRSHCLNGLVSRVSSCLFSFWGTLSLEKIFQMALNTVIIFVFLF